jgi:hypothetical protein
MQFADLALNALILKAIAEQGYQSPTPIQQKTIPVILKGKDVLGGAQTGTGKTAAFTLPILQKLSDHPKTLEPKQIRCLVLTPTRELAQQVADNIAAYARHLPLKTAVFYGGTIYIRAPSVCISWKCWCWMRPIGCWIWALFTISNGLWPSYRHSAKLCYSQLLFLKKSKSWLIIY